MHGFHAPDEQHNDNAETGYDCAPSGNYQKNMLQTAVIETIQPINIRE